MTTPIALNRRTPVPSGDRLNKGASLIHTSKPSFVITGPGISGWSIVPAGAWTTIERPSCAICASYSNWMSPSSSVRTVNVVPSGFEIVLNGAVCISFAATSFCNSSKTFCGSRIIVCLSDSLTTTSSHKRLSQYQAHFPKRREQIKSGSFWESSDSCIQEIKIEHHRV